VFLFKKTKTISWRYRKICSYLGTYAGNTFSFIFEAEWRL